MNLNFLFGFQNNTSATNANNPAANTFQATGPPADMTSFKTGQTVQGEVVAVRNNEVILQLEDGGQINAKLTKEIPIQVGQTMTFEVKSNNGMRLSLSPLFENMGHDPNALKALNAAGLPESARNITMVSLMMRQGLAVDKNSLLNFNRQMTANPTANPVTLAQMNRLEIPTTPENIRQFEAYKNYEHQISQAVREITDGLIKDIGQMALRGETDSVETAKAVALFKQVLNIFEGQIKPEATLNPAQSQAVIIQPGAGVLNPEQILNQNTTTNPATLYPDSILNQNIAANPATLNPDLTLNQNAIANPAMLNPADALEQIAVLPATDEGQSATAFQATTEGLPTTVQTISDPTFISLMELAPENRAQLALLMREVGFSPELTNAVNEGVLNQTTLLSLINHELTQNPELLNNPKMVSLLTNRDFQALIKNDINNQWLLRPEDVAKERFVEEHFNKIFGQANKLLETLNSAGRGESPVAQATANLSGNINFVNQLNQMFTYIQLPLKMNGENTHAELFVYTNKKNLAKNDGNVSALLHLDMEYLGPLDVYIAMQNKKVSTKFYLANDRMIDFVAEHIHILNERLQERGYAMSSEFVARKPDKKPIDEILEATKNVSVLASYSFDARA